MSPLPGSPMGPLWGEMPVSRTFLYITFRVPSKGVWSPPQVPLTMLPHRETLHFQSPPSSISQRPWYVGPLWREMPISRDFLYITFSIPSPPPGSPHRAPIERDAPFPEPSNYLSKFPVNGPPP